MDNELIKDKRKDAEPPKPEPPLAKPKVFNSIKLGTLKYSWTRIPIASSSERLSLYSFDNPEGLIIRLLNNLLVFNLFQLVQFYNFLF